MKFLLSLYIGIAFAISAVSPLKAHAGTVNKKPGMLTCGASYRSMHATLDYRGWDPTSPYFSVQDATVVDNYRGARLHCVGHTLDSISCVGYWNDIEREIVEIHIEETSSGLAATLTALKGEFPAEPMKWDCRATL